MVYFGEELATFGCVWAFSSHRNLSLFLRILNYSANESKTLLLSDQSLQGRVLEVLPCRVRVEGRVDDVGEGEGERERERERECGVERI